MAKACVCSVVLTTTASNSLGVVVEPAEVAESSGFRMLRRGPFDGRLEHVAEGHDVLGRDVAEVRRPPPAHADAGDVELLVQVPTAQDAGAANVAAAAPAITRANCRRLC